MNILVLVVQWYSSLILVGYSIKGAWCMLVHQKEVNSLRKHVFAELQSSVVLIAKTQMVANC